MVNDGRIKVEVLDSRNEYRPVNNRNTIDWPQAASGAMLAIFGLICIFAPKQTLSAITVVAAVIVIIAGIIGIVSYLRYRNTLLARSGGDVFFSAMLIVFGVALVAHPMLGVVAVAWIAGLGLILFGLAQLLMSRDMILMLSGLGIFLGITGGLMVLFGVLIFVWPQNMALFLGFFALVYAADLIVMSLPMATDKGSPRW